MSTDTAAQANLPFIDTSTTASISFVAVTDPWQLHGKGLMAVAGPRPPSPRPNSGAILVDPIPQVTCRDAVCVCVCFSCVQGCVVCTVRVSYREILITGHVILREQMRVYLTHNDDGTIEADFNKCLQQ